MDKKKLFLFLISLLVLLSMVAFAFAAGSSGKGEALTSWVSGLVKWTIRIAGLVAFLSLVYGGLRYLLATGSVDAMKRARQQMIAGFGSLLIIITSYIVLQTINPQILGGIPEAEVAPGTSSPSAPPSEQEVVPFVYQEIPFGTLLETRILAKNISCFNESNQLVDCHSQTAISQEEKETIAQKMTEEFPEQWPDAQPEDAEIAYQCYAFDEDGEFIDADPNQPGIQPTLHRDRLDCLEKINQAIQAKSEFLRDRVKELAQLSAQCACGVCGCGTCPCIPFGTCPCGAPCGGDPCPGRGRMIQIRKQLFREGGCGLFMNQVIQGHDCLKDSELVKVDVDHYQDLTVVNQIRWLTDHFLPPYSASLTTDLSYLVKAENTYKNYCPYRATISHSSLYDLKNRGEPSTQIKFCVNSNDAQWGEECIEEQQLGISKYCRDFNCQDCQENGKKLFCEKCNLDDLEKGKLVEWSWEDQIFSTYQCSKFLINNEEGKDEIDPTDQMGVMCRIMPPSEEIAEATDQERQCYDFYDQDALTLYCPDVGTKKAEQLRSRSFLEEGVIDPLTEKGFPIGTIFLGEMIDNAENYIPQLTKELAIIIKTSTPEIVCPSYDKNDPDNQCKLFHLPPRCRCDGCQVTQDSAGCGPGCFEQHGCRCNNCGNCPQCPCSTCLCPGSISPCPIRTIFQRRKETQKWFEEDEEAIKPKTDRVIDLIEAENLLPDDEDRRELICQLVDSRTKFDKAIPGFGHIPEGEMTAVDLNNCLTLLERMELRELIILPEFDDCYPYNSPDLTAEEQEACRRDRASVQCRDAIKDLMQNFFFIEEGRESG